MQTMQAFIAAHGITMETTMVDRNPHMDDMPQGSTHWLCTITADGSTMEVHFSMGPAHCAEPELPEVLDCLASDATTVENAQTFLDWCAELGYDDDSRRAERTYRATVEQTEALRGLLGAKAVEWLMYDTERL